VVDAGWKLFVVVDWQEGKQRYDGIGERSVVFSPDNRRVAYVALVFEGILGFIKVGKKSHMVVIDGQEGSKYDGIVAPPEGEGIIFDSTDQLHYMGRKGNAFYLVEERLA